MIANIKSLSDGVIGLTKHINELYGALEKVNTVAGKTLKDAKGAVSTVGGSMGLGSTTRIGTGADGARFGEAIGSGGGNLISRSMGKFSSFAQSPGGQAATLGAGVGLSVAAGAYAAVPDVSLTMQRSVGYYQAGLKAPGINRNQLERATFGAMAGGLSSVGSDAAVAALLAGRGYTPGSANYLQAAGQVGGAYRYLGMDNAAAAASIAGFQSGPMAANLFQYGISTTGPGGKEKTTGQLAKELMNYMTGGASVSVEQVNRSFQKGALGANLANMGFDAGQQEILKQAMIDIASGRNPDLANASPMKGNANTALTAAGRMAASQTGLMTKAEDSMIKGFENAASTVEAFNRALSNVIQPLAQLKGYVGGVGGTNLGAAAGTTGSMLGGLLKKAAGVTLLAGAGALEGASFGGATPLAVGVGTLGFNLVTKGGASTGYGASFGVGSPGRTGGSSPVAGAAVSVGYGATDNSGIWASTGNTHTGTDYAVAKGTPVTVAYADGIVSQVDINSDYGTSVMIDHADGTQTLYGHLSERSVKVGDAVKLGQRIGKSGDSGNANGPHLHFEMRKGKNNPVDPSKYLTGSGSTNALLNMGYTSTIPTSADLLSTTSSSPSKSSTSSTPYVGSGNYAKTALDDKTLRTTLSNAGFSGQGLENAMKIARAESGGRAGALNPTAATGDYSMGLFQINMIGDLGKKRNAQYLKDYGSIGYTGPESLYDPAINSKIAYAISKGGTKWSDAWVNSSKKVGIGGATSGYGASVTPAPTTALSQGNKTVNVTLKIERASEQEAMQFAKLVKTYLENDHEISRIGSS